MNKKLIQEWVAALRSLSYTHGTGTLRSIDNRFCPLGVLCDISKDVLGLEWQERGKQYRIGGSVSSVPSIIIDYLGFDCNNSFINISNSKIPSEIREDLGKIDKTSIIRLNDDYYLTNYQIADILEEELLHENSATNLV